MHLHTIYAENLTSKYPNKQTNKQANKSKSSLLTYIFYHSFPFRNRKLQQNWWDLTHLKMKNIFVQQKSILFPVLIPSSWVVRRVYVLLPMRGRGGGVDGGGNEHEMTETGEKSNTISALPQRANNYEIRSVKINGNKLREYVFDYRTNCFAHHR